MVGRDNGSLLAAREEGLDAVGELLAAGLRFLEVRLELQRALVARLQGVVYRALGRRKRLARLLRELTGEIANLFLEAVRGYDAVDDAEAVRVLRRQRLAREEHLVSHGGPSQARQKPADPAIRGQADVDERLHQVRLGRGDPDVARQRVARADADGRTVHRGDRRLRHGAQAREHRHVLVAQDVAYVFRRPHSTAADHLGDVSAGAEGAAAARENDDANGVIALGLLDRLAELLPRTRADRVHL